LNVPAGAWDCHAHVIEDPSRFPLSPTRDYDPPLAPLDAYLALLDRYGITHGLLVQPSVYGFDNRCLLDALERAEGRLLGVAVPAPDSTAKQLEDMHGRGIRGVRCNQLYPRGLSLETVMTWQPILQELGWHVGMHIEIDAIAELRTIVERVQLPIVIDHMGRPALGHTHPSEPRLQQLVELVRSGHCYVKLSAPYRFSDEAAPWADVRPLARALLDTRPDRCLWATDWPHTDSSSTVHETDLFEALSDWCPDMQTRRTVLTDAPVTLLHPENIRGR
jgi:predicted TIM-barrel fold metal-dependent hydrolase